MDLAAERSFGLRGAAVEIDPDLTVGSWQYGEAVGNQPRPDFGDVRGIGAEKFAKLGRRQPAVIVDRLGIQLLGEQLLEVGSLLGGGFQVDVGA